jgi:seryl-tRNA synthetase
MIDIKIIREQPDFVQKISQQKAVTVNIARLIEVDAAKLTLESEIEKLRADRNAWADAFKATKPTAEQLQQGKEIKVTIQEKEALLVPMMSEWLQLYKSVPNIPDSDTPIGTSEDDNVVMYEKGDKPAFEFTVKNHAEIAASRGWLDKDRAAKVSGARFAYLKGDLVRLQFAVIQFVFDSLTNEDVLKDIAKNAGLDVSTRPFTLVLPPYMINTAMYDAMDRLQPSDDRYKIADTDLWLQGSAEHVLGSMYANESLDVSELPLRMLGYATSFRQEAGTYGKDMEGIIRLHQFDKLEMESFTTAENGLNEHVFFVAIQEYLVSKLGLSYRKLQKCTYDIGKPNSRGVDIEVWLPGQGKYRETHTADYMTDYQARRLQTKVKGGGLVHTNDATAFALGRILVAILENYQNEDYSVRVPEVLQNYLGGRKVL